MTMPAMAPPERPDLDWAAGVGPGPVEAGCGPEVVRGVTDDWLFGRELLMTGITCDDAETEVGPPPALEKADPETDVASTSET